MALYTLMVWTGTRLAFLADRKHLAQELISG
jgi:hypothetical protein